MRRSCHMCFGSRDSKTAVSCSPSREVIFVCSVTEGSEITFHVLLNSLSCKPDTCAFQKAFMYNCCCLL